MVLILMIFDIDALTLNSHAWKGIKLLRAIIGAHNSNLWVLVTHASHVCSQHSFGLSLRMSRNAQNLT